MSIRRVDQRRKVITLPLMIFPPGSVQRYVEREGVIAGLRYQLLVCVYRVGIPCRLLCLIDGL